MKSFRVIICIFILFLSFVVYPISMKLVKHEDFIGSYYCINIESDIIMEICGTSTRILDQKENEAIISDIDSMVVVDGFIYGRCKNNYFSLNIANRKVVYSPIPILQYSTCSLLCPMEYYERMTRFTDIVGLILLFCCIIFIMKVGLFNFSKKKQN